MPFIQINDIGHDMFLSFGLQTSIFSTTRDLSDIVRMRKERRMRQKPSLNKQNDQEIIFIKEAETGQSKNLEARSVQLTTVKD